MACAPALVVAGADNLAALQDSFEWALHKMAKPGGWAQGRTHGGRGSSWWLWGHGAGGPLR